MLKPGLLKRLLESGELYRIAAICESVPEFAQRLGMTQDALHGQFRRLRDAGFDVSTPLEMLHRAHRLGTYANDGGAANDLDEWNVKPTARDIAPLIEAVRASEGNDNVQERDGKPPALEPVEEHRLKRKLRELEAQNKALIERLSNAEDRLDIVGEAMQQRIAPIVPHEKRSGLREGTAVILLSDAHLEEAVRPEQVNGLNEFNLDIARRRMERMWQGARWFIEAQRQDFTIRSATLWLGGDLFTGYLHDDNIESNQLAPPAAFAFAKQCAADGIRYLLQDPQIERLVVPCNDGNHSRLSIELRAASRTEMSLETLMYGLLADEFRHEPRVQFEIAAGDHLYTRIYDKEIRWTHGAEFKGGNGVGGIMVPIYRGLGKYQTTRRSDITVMGHFHSATNLNDLVINGSVIGYSAYALRIGARYEPPQQLAFMMDSKRGKSVCAPIWVADHEEQRVAA